jgi:hypothetical protein
MEKKTQKKEALNTDENNNDKNINKTRDQSDEFDNKKRPVFERKIKINDNETFLKQIFS